MYNKLILFAIAFTFCCSTQLYSSSKHVNAAAKNGQPTNFIVPVKQQQDQQDLTGHLIVSLPTDISNGHGIPQTDDDGKSHQFQFNRFTKRKYELIFCLFAKIVLFVAHLCFLIGNYLHFSY